METIHIDILDRDDSWYRNCELRRELEAGIAATDKYGVTFFIPFSYIKRIIYLEQ